MDMVTNKKVERRIILKMKPDKSPHINDFNLIKEALKYLSLQEEVMPADVICFENGMTSLCGNRLMEKSKYR